MSAQSLSTGLCVAVGMMLAAASLDDPARAQTPSPTSETLDARWFTADTGPDAFSQPIAGLSGDELARFFRGRGLFRQNWVIAPAQDERIDGLGPLYNRLSCAGCHERNGRGFAPAGPDDRLRSMLVRLSVREPDGRVTPHPAYGDQFNEEANPGIPAEGRLRITWRYHDRRLPDGQTVTLRTPDLRFDRLAYGPIQGQIEGPSDASGDAPIDRPLDMPTQGPAGGPATAAAVLLTSMRVGQPLIGQGLLDLAALPPGPRFGHKANVDDLRTQVAAAFAGDLGLTTSLFPASTCTPAQTACLAAPSGGSPEVDDTQLDDVVFYLARLAIPQRRDRDDPQVRRGEQAFDRLGCVQCHRTDLRTGEAAKPHTTGLSATRLPAYSDMLRHDMGDGLADGRPDGPASGHQWRTPPLWGLGLTEVVGEEAGYLHDGRARNLLEAVLWHDGEARAARQAFEATDRSERDALLRFLRSL